MSSESVLWSLLHIESKTQVDSLTFQQTKILISSFDPTEYLKWAAWYEGSADWQLVDDLVTELGLPPRAKIAPPLPPNKPPTFTGVSQGPTATASMPSTVSSSSPGHSYSHDHLTQSNATINPEGRLSRRVSKRYKVYVGTKGKMHESTTLDLSLTGLQIMDEVPPGNEGNLEVALVNSKGESLSLICALIPGDRRTRLKIIRVGKLDQLQSWLQDSTN